MRQEDSLNTETYTLALRVHEFRGLLGCARTFCIHETEEVNADKGTGGGGFLLQVFSLSQRPLLAAAVLPPQSL